MSIYDPISVVLGIEPNPELFMKIQEPVSKEDMVFLGNMFPVLTGEDHHQYGKPRSAETKRKISESRKGQSLQKWSEDRRKKTVESLKTKSSFLRLTPEERSTQARERMLGKKRSQETKEKMMKSQQRRRLLESNKLDTPGQL